jgi:hypothetical protein
VNDSVQSSGADSTAGTAAEPAVETICCSNDSNDEATSSAASLAANAASPRASAVAWLTAADRADHTPTPVAEASNTPNTTK